MSLLKIVQWAEIILLLFIGCSSYFMLKRSGKWRNFRQWFR
jgi:hypothetical protein